MRERTQRPELTGHHLHGVLSEPCKGEGPFWFNPPPPSQQVLSAPGAEEEEGNEVLAWAAVSREPGTPWRQLGTEGCRGRGLVVTLAEGSVWLWWRRLARGRLWKALSPACSLPASQTVSEELSLCPQICVPSSPGYQTRADVSSTETSQSTLYTLHAVHTRIPHDPPPPAPLGLPPWATGERALVGPNRSL